jgi:hypothetical protein
MFDLYSSSWDDSLVDDAIAIAFKHSNTSLLETLLHNFDQKKYRTPSAAFRCALHHAVRYDVSAILRAIMFYDQRLSTEVKKVLIELQNGIPILTGPCPVAK